MGRSQNPNNDKYFSRFRHYVAYFSNYAIVYKDLTAMPPFFSNVVAKLIGITEKGVEYNLNKLQKDKKLTRLGAKKDGQWKILDNESLHE